MRNPLDMMKIRSNFSKIAYQREKSETHNVFGHNIRISNKSPGGLKDHSGWDLLAAEKTPVYAIEDGVVVEIWHDRSTKNYGNQIQLEFLSNGKNYIAFYAHLHSIYVHKHAHVMQGKVIGSTGHTGNAHNLSPSQYHLHFEIRTKHGAGKHGSIDPAILLGGEMLTCHL
jgi:murein DD-endopeptidase MepM/ murein hydrolase activator NlpD